MSDTPKNLSVGTVSAFSEQKDTAHQMKASEQDDSRGCTHIPNEQEATPVTDKGLSDAEQKGIPSEHGRTVVKNEAPSQLREKEVPRGQGTMPETGDVSAQHDQIEIPSEQGATPVTDQASPTAERKESARGETVSEPDNSPSCTDIPNEQDTTPVTDHATSEMEQKGISSEHARRPVKNEAPSEEGEKEVPSEQGTMPEADEVSAQDEQIEIRSEQGATPVTDQASPTAERKESARREIVSGQEQKPGTPGASPVAVHTGWIPSTPQKPKVDRLSRSEQRRSLGTDCSLLRRLFHSPPQGTHRTPSTKKHYRSSSKSGLGGPGSAKMSLKTLAEMEQEEISRMRRLSIGTEAGQRRMKKERKKHHLSSSKSGLGGPGSANMSLK